MSPRTALVTGAARGIGREIARALAADGVTVLGPARAELDLADPESVRRYVQANAGAPIDILVNNAGINELAPIEAIDDGVWATMFQVNLTSPMQLIRGLTGHMRARRWGRIVNVSTVFSLVARERRGAYSATKGALNALTRGAAVELGPHGILVNAVCPGYVETDLTTKNNTPAELAAITGTIPLGRMASPAEVAELVRYLCSEANTYMTGQAVVVDGGFTCR